MCYDSVFLNLFSQMLLMFVFCFTVGKAAYFNGQSRISFNAHNPNSLYTTIDVVRFRFKTNENEGLIFYGGGNQGDYIVLDLD